MLTRLGSYVLNSKIEKRWNDEIQNTKVEVAFGEEDRD